MLAARPGTELWSIADRMCAAAAKPLRRWSVLRLGLRVGSFGGAPVHLWLKFWGYRGTAKSVEEIFSGLHTLSALWLQVFEFSRWRFGC